MNISKMKKLIAPFALSLILFSCNNAEQNTETTQIPEEVNEETPDQESTMGKLPLEYVEMTTTKGKIVLELDPNSAPVTTANFLSYVDEGFYDGTIFHRVIPTFMIQGGGFTTQGERKETKSPIVLESDNGLSNSIGTIAMARTAAPNSATAQFFINVANNDFLDYKPSNPGYAVFGRVIEGMDVVNEIRQVKTGRKNGMPDWPLEDVVIEKVVRAE
jgi:cyclophilin family peptidyl-prolyl cis-trans isomerase